MHGPGKRPEVPTGAPAEPRPAGLAGASARRWLMARPYLLLTLTTLSWAGNAVASRLATGHISPMALTALRWVGVVLLLAPVMTGPVRAAAPILAPLWLRLLAMGALGFTAFNALM